MRKILSIAALLLFASNAWALTEICGNGVDDDASGGDASCPAPDADGDGYTTDGSLLGKDCDDTNRRIFPGAEVTAGCSAGTYKTCQSDGTYTSCSAACPSGTCYYVDPVGGLDVNAGTSRATAFLTLNCVSYYASGAPACNKHSVLASGDHIYLLAGTHVSMHTESGYDSVGLMLKNKTGITIHFEGAAIINLPTVALVTPGAGIYLENCTNCTIKGGTAGRVTDIHSTSGASAIGKGAVTATDSSGLTIHGLQIDNNHSHGDENGSGLYVHTCNAFDIHHNILYDEIRDAGNVASICLAVFWRGTSGRYHHNVQYYTSGATAYCGIKYKHGHYGGTFEFDHNIQSKAPGLATAQGGTYFHHNVIADPVYTSVAGCGADDGAAIMSCDWGGTNFTGTARTEYNTIINSKAWNWAPSNDYGTDDLSCTNCGSFGTYLAKYNVVSDNAANYTTNHGIVSVDTYGTDADYTSVITGGKFSENYNCFYNTGAVALGFTLYGSTAGGPTLGDFFTFAQMQAALYDVNSFNTNPTLTAGTNVATAGSCTSFGWNAGETVAASSTLTPISVLNSKKRGKKWKSEN